MIISLPLKRTLNLKRRAIASKDSRIYGAEFIEVSNQSGLTGYGEVIESRQLAEELAYLHLVLLENNFDFKLPHEKIPIAGMIELSRHCEAASPPRNDDNLALIEVQELISHGFKTLKFKVGTNWALEAEVLQEIRSQIGPEIDIRLDANRAFDYEEAVQFGKCVADLKIAYFEEPLRDISRTPQFYQATGISVALDETLIEDMPELEGVSTYALKPFLMPSLNSIFECIKQAEDRGIDIAICSAFETPYSLNWLVLLAAMTQGKLLPAGLSTYRWFEGQPLKAEFSVKQTIELLNSGKPTQSRLPAS